MLFLILSMLGLMNFSLNCILKIHSNELMYLHKVKQKGIGRFTTDYTLTIGVTNFSSASLFNIESQIDIGSSCSLSLGGGGGVSRVGDGGEFLTSVTGSASCFFWKINDTMVLCC